MADNSSNGFRPSIEVGQPDGSRAESSQCTGKDPSKFGRISAELADIRIGPLCQQQSQEQPSHNAENRSNGDPGQRIQRPGL